MIEILKEMVILLLKRLASMGLVGAGGWSNTTKHIADMNAILVFGACSKKILYSKI